jgi:hypothetical protein
MNLTTALLLFFSMPFLLDPSPDGSPHTSLYHCKHLLLAVATIVLDHPAQLFKKRKGGQILCQACIWYLLHGRA